MTQTRLTGYAHGGGCACKIPPGELEEAVRGLVGQSSDNVLVGLDDGDDAAAVLVGDIAVLSTADSSPRSSTTPSTGGRIAAANALSDIYRDGRAPGRRDQPGRLAPRPAGRWRLLTEVLCAAGWLVASEAGCPVIGGHSIDDPRTEVRHGGHRGGRPGAAAAQRTAPSQACR